MSHLARPSRAGRIGSVIGLTLAATLTAALPALAVPPGWTSPTRVYTDTSAPTHAMVTDPAGYTHIATQRGSAGIWYVTNTSGAWASCQLSSGNDREPSIAYGGGAVHIAFARRTSGQAGIYTASSDQPGSAAGCGWAITRRYAGTSSYPSLAAYGDTLSIAFRSTYRKLKFTKGPASSETWGVLEVIDANCCTSAPSLDLTTNGAPRVAYGDGTKQAKGLRYAVRAGSGWKKSRASGGRVLNVSMVLDKSPGVFAPPSNAPKIVYVLKKRGTYLATKGSSYAGGAWSNRFFGKYFGSPDVSHSSNVTNLIYGGGGRLIWVRMSGAIWQPQTFSSTGRDVKPQLHGSVVTFARKSGGPGIYYTHR